MRQEKRAGLPSAGQMGDRQAQSRALQSKELRDVIKTKINLKEVYETDRKFDKTSRH